MNNWIAPEVPSGGERQSSSKSVPSNEASDQRLTMPKKKIERNIFTLRSKPPGDNLSLMRSKKLEGIVLNKCSDKIDVTSVISCFLGVVLSIASTALNTCWPQHNPLRNPTHWYESVFIISTSWNFLAASFLTGVSHFCVVCLGKGSVKPFAVISAVGTLSILSYFSLSWYIWVQVLEWRYPIPYQGMLCGIVGWHSMLLTLWFQYPKAWRSEKRVKTRVILGIAIGIQATLVNFTYNGIENAFERMPENYQWLLVFVLIAVREVNAWLTPYLSKTITGVKKDLAFDAIGTHYSAIRHIMFLSVNLGSKTTELTTYLMLGIDFSINISFALMALWYNRNEQNQERKADIVLALIINEAAEFLMPIAYSICLLMAYYGPNAGMLGNIKFGGWNFSEITNIETNLFWILVLFFADFGSTVISAILLKMFGNMNIFKMYIQMQRELGFLFIIEQGYIVCEVHKIYSKMLGNKNHYIT